MSRGVHLLQEYRILLIDDEPFNLGVLSNILEQHGVELLTARCGERGLEIAQLNHPDLILLDVMMPGIDGFETCRQLKKSPETADIPVIFTTVLDDLENKLSGFQAGAVDYLPKPFQEEEVVARVGKHLENHHLRHKLQQRNAELERINGELKAFAHTVAHNLKTPIGQAKSISDSLLAVDFETPEFVRLARRFLPLLTHSAGRMLTTVDALLLMAELDREQESKLLATVDVRGTALEALITLELSLKQQKAKVTLAEGSWPRATGYGPWLVEVWKNYLSNALKYGGIPPQIHLGWRALEGAVEYWVQDNGPGLRAEQCQTLFTPFSRLHKNSVEGHGLGLSIVQRIIQIHNGQAGVEGNPGSGSRFYFRLPGA